MVLNCAFVADLSSPSMTRFPLFCSADPHLASPPPSRRWVATRCAVWSERRPLLYLLPATPTIGATLAGSRSPCFFKSNCTHLLGRPSSTTFTDAYIVADDQKYGGKKVITLTPRIYQYMLSHVPEPQILRQLREETATMRGSQMQVSPEQAQFLAILVQILGARRCIEVGAFTGYSSLAVALALPESSLLVACDRDEHSLEVARRYYERAGVAQKVDVRHGLAADTLNCLISNGESGSYDFAFIDADKRMYLEYFELLLQLVRVGGVLVFDNVLWQGKVADPEVNDPKTVSIREFNKKMMEDDRVSISMVPIGDGITICRKR